MGMRERTFVLVAIDLDPMPGAMHDAEEVPGTIQQVLNDRLGHYKPAVVAHTVRDCDREFDAHEHNDRECERMLYAMAGAEIAERLAWEAEQYNREAEEQMLGRPLFPNER